jgi:hypothetical protein
MRTQNFHSYAVRLWAQVTRKFLRYLLPSPTSPITRIQILLVRSRNLLHAASHHRDPPLHPRCHPHPRSSSSASRDEADRPRRRTRGPPIDMPLAPWVAPNNQCLSLLCCFAVSNYQISSTGCVSLICCNTGRGSMWLGVVDL